LNRLFRVVALLAAFGFPASAGAVEWMTVDAAARTVTLLVTAGWNDENSGLNYNGLHDGAATVTVPVGWSVRLRFDNKDQHLPHSVLVTRRYPEGKMPDVLHGSDVVIHGARSQDLDKGRAHGGAETILFRAAPAGSYLLACGILTHAQAGMWLHLEVVNGGSPGVRTAGSDARP
jgi:sulfocyanin